MKVSAIVLSLVSLTMAVNALAHRRPHPHRHPRKRVIVVKKPVVVIKKVRPRTVYKKRPVRIVYVTPIGRSTYQGRPSVGAYYATTYLGHTNLTDSKDFDKIFLPSCSTYANQRISSLKLLVRKYPAEIDYVELTFENGGSQVLGVREFYGAYTATRWIDLVGENRCVRSIKIVGDTETDNFFDNSRQASILFYGR